MTFGSLFAGIGGFDLGLERAGMECRWQVEIDDYCQRVLAKHWPDVAKFKDIRDVGRENLEPVDIICGGYPCQPFSQAGKRRGEEDDRHLWPEMFRVIQELRPTWVLGENVAGHINLGLDQVLLDLEAEDYARRSFVIPALGVDAPHHRYRVFTVAHAEDANWRGADAEENCRRGASEVGGPSECGGRPEYWLPEPDVGRVAYGVPKRLDRLKCLGNAVVPQVVEIIGGAIMQAEEAYR